MSLEDALNANTKAVLAHNALLEKMLAGAKPATPAPAADKKPAASAEDKKPAAPAADKKPAAPAGSKKPEPPKAPSIATISTRFGNYMKNEDTRDEAVANVRNLVAHYGAPKLTEIDPKHFPKLLEYLDKWEAGEEVEFEALDEDEASGDEEEGGALI